MSTPEGRVKAKLKRRLTDEFGIQCWRFMPVQTGYGAPALDFILCFRGWYVTIETKTPDGQFSPTQINTRRETLDAGGIVFCVYDDETLDYCINHLKQLGFIHGRYDAKAIPLYAQDARERQKYLRAQQQAEAPDRAARRDNGAPRKKSKRQPVTGTGGPHQPVTAAVNDIERDQLDPACDWMYRDHEVGC